MTARITTGRFAKVLERFYPQITRDMVRYDAETGKLRTFPNFRDRSWTYINPDHIPEYLIVQHKISPDIVREVLQDLRVNFNPLKLIAA